MLGGDGAGFEVAVVGGDGVAGLDALAGGQDGGEVAEANRGLGGGLGGQAEEEDVGAAELAHAGGPGGDAAVGDGVEEQRDLVHQLEVAGGRQLGDVGGQVGADGVDVDDRLGARLLADALGDRPARLEVGQVVGVGQLRGDDIGKLAAGGASGRLLAEIAGEQRQEGLEDVGDEDGPALLAALDGDGGGGGALPLGHAVLDARDGQRIRETLMRQHDEGDVGRAPTRDVVGARPGWNHGRERAPARRLALSC